MGPKMTTPKSMDFQRILFCILRENLGQQPAGRQPQAAQLNPNLASNNKRQQQRRTYHHHHRKAIRRTELTPAPIYKEFVKLGLDKGIRVFPLRVRNQKV